MGVWSAVLEEPFMLEAFVESDSSFVFQQIPSPLLKEFLTDLAGPPTTIEIAAVGADWFSVLQFANAQSGVVTGARKKDD